MVGDEEVDEMLEEIEDWLDDVVSCGIWVAHTVRQNDHCLVLKVVMGDKDTDKIPDILTMQSTLEKFMKLQEIRTFLEELQPLVNLSQKQQVPFQQQAF